MSSALGDSMFLTMFYVGFEDTLLLRLMAAEPPPVSDIGDTESINTAASLLTREIRKSVPRSQELGFVVMGIIITVLRNTQLPRVNMKCKYWSTCYVGWLVEQERGKQFHKDYRLSLSL
jgi:hypothetical protein